jgi:hypothetical protein
MVSTAIAIDATKDFIMFIIITIALFVEESNWKYGIRKNDINGITPDLNYDASAQEKFNSFAYCE